WSCERGQYHPELAGRAGRAGAPEQQRGGSGRLGSCGPRAERKRAECVDADPGGDGGKSLFPVVAGGAVRVGGLAARLEMRLSLSIVSRWSETEPSKNRQSARGLRQTRPLAKHGRGAVWVRGGAT